MESSEFEVPESNLWADFVWPEWVPQRQRELIEGFWAESYGRGPRAWLRDVAIQRMPALGARVRMRRLCSESEIVVGRYIHRWNNIGAVVLDDGTCESVSFGEVTDEQLARMRERSAETIARKKAELERQTKLLAALDKELANAD